MWGGIILFAVASALLNDGSNITWNIGKYSLHFTGLGETTATELYIGFPMALNIAFSGVLFIYTGFVSRIIYELIKDNKILLFITWVLSAILGTLLFYMNRGNEVLIAMSYAHYGNYILFIGAAVMLSYSVLILSKYIDNNFFSRLGKYTLAIYGFHLTLTFVGQKFANIIHLSDANLKATIIGTITLILSCLVIPVIRYIDSNLLGERNK